MTMTLLLDRLRILIALAVLKSTPVDQTLSSYILSLRDAFPSSESPFEFWKDHVQALESECIELRAALGRMQTRLFIDEYANSAQPAELCQYSVSSSSDNTDLLGTKKRSKKKPDSTAQLEVMNLIDIFKFGRVNIRLGRPFEAMETFLRLCSLSDRPGFPRKAFLTATCDVCKAISSAFGDATREHTNLRTLQVVQATICSVVDKAVPLVLSWASEHDEPLSLLFDNLLDLFINPVIHAFLIVSERNLNEIDSGDSPSAFGPNHISSQPPSADYVDDRVAILALLQITFFHIQLALSFPVNKDSAGEVWKSHSVDALLLAHADFFVMILSLTLTIVRHLRDILREGDTTQKQKPTRRHRVKRLAVKDALWYLCSTVHFLLDLQNRLILDGTKVLARQKHRLVLLTHTILDIMVDLVLCQDRKRASDYAERHLTAKTVLRACVETQELSPPTLTNAQATDYVVLDDMEYRMLMSLVERCLALDYQNLDAI